MLSLGEFKEELQRYRRILVTEENVDAARAFPRGSAFGLWRLGSPIGPDHPHANSFGPDYRFVEECAPTDIPIVGDVISMQHFAQIE